MPSDAAPLPVRAGIAGVLSNLNEPVTAIAALAAGACPQDAATDAQD